jgi:acetamidase/formamidase
LRGGNPSSGCIYIEGARAGDLLAVHVGEIALSDMGFTHFGGRNGAVPGWFGATGIGEQSRIVRIEDGKIHWQPGLELPAKPMLGFVGVAPPFERFSNAWAGYWGGNFDIQEITTGATVYLPIYVDGALLHVGDMHAIQGDGEICGAGGIETEGVVRLRCEVMPLPEGMLGPRIESSTHIMTVGLARPAEDAFRHALENLVLWIETEYGIQRGEAYLLLAQVLEARATQFVNPTITYVAKVAKRYLGAASG